MLGDFGFAAAAWASCSHRAPSAVRALGFVILGAAVFVVREELE